MIPLARRLAGLALCLSLATAASAVASPAGARTGVVEGSNVVLAPTSTARNELVLFLPGTGRTPAESREFLETATNLGFPVIGLAYVNGTSANRACRKETSRQCQGQFRREVIYGDDLSTRVQVSKTDSIVERLKMALSTSGFFQFLTPDGEPNWSAIVVTGHSQGAGHAAVLGIDKSVARVAMLAGPNDLTREGKLPAWVTTGQTSPAKWYGLASDLDDSFGKQMQSWDKFGLAAVNKGEVPTSAQRLVTTLQALDDRNHESVAVDQWLVRGDGEPRLTASWTYLLTGNLDGDHQQPSSDSVGQRY